MHKARLRRQLERVWEQFWQVGIHDPGTILEQILYLLFLRRLDSPAGATGVRLAPACTSHGIAPAALRWRSFCQLPGAALFALLSDHVYPALRTIGPPGAAYSLHLKDVCLRIPSAPALVNIVRMLDQLPRQADLDDDAFGYVADKLARLGRRGECQTPGPIELLMVAMVAPAPGDVICSPVSGCGNFLVAAARYVRARYPAALADPAVNEHFHHRMFHGYDADKTMLRLCCMKLLLEGLGNPALRYTSSVVPDIDGDDARYSVILAHPSAASLPGGADVAQREQATGMMLAQFVRSLRPGGRAAVVVPGRIMTGATESARKVRQLLMREQRLDALIPLQRMRGEPGRAGSRSLLLFTRTDGVGRSEPSRPIHMPDAGRVGKSATVPTPTPVPGEVRCA